MTDGIPVPFAIPLDRRDGPSDPMADWPEDMLIHGTNDHALYHLVAGDVGASAYQIYRPPLKFAYLDNEPWDLDEIVMILEGGMKHWESPESEPTVFQAGDIIWAGKGQTGIQEMLPGKSGVYREVAVHPGTGATSRFVDPGAADIEVAAGAEFAPLRPIPVSTAPLAGTGRQLEPFPDRSILGGRSDHRERELFAGDVVISIHEAKPVRLSLDRSIAPETDTIRLVLEGELRFQAEGATGSTSFCRGSLVFVPKGSVGILEMSSATGLFRELVCSPGDQCGVP